MLDVVALVGIVVGVVVVVVVGMVLLVAAFENLRLAYEDPFELPIVQWGYPALFFLEMQNITIHAQGESYIVLFHIT